jgi:uncharacterized protein YjbI with pentapeptide repeats
VSPATAGAQIVGGRRYRAGVPASGTTPKLPRLDPAALVEDDEPLLGELDRYRARLTGTHVAGSGHGELAEFLADGVNLSSTHFDPLDLSDVQLDRVDLAGARWEQVTARRFAVSDSRLVGWRLHCTFAEDLLVSGCRWDDGAFYLGRAKGSVVFRDCSFAGTTLRGDFSGVVFEGCDLAGAEIGVDAARNCDLRTSRLAGARDLGRFKGARITAEQAIGIADLLATELGFRLN